MAEQTGLEPTVTAMTVTQPYASPILREANERLNYWWRLAKVVAASKRFPDALAAEQAMAKILLGAELGLTPMQSLTGIHIVEGRPQVAAVVLASFVRQHPTYDFRVLVHTTEACSIEFGTGKAPGRDATGEWLPWPDALGTSSFSIADAERAGLVKPRGNWEKWPQNMCYARAMSNGVKWFVPDATGGVPVYHEGEIVETQDVTEGESSGEAPGVDLPEAVVDIIRRAGELGHAGYSNRPAIEMLLGGRDVDYVAKWVAAATEDLDRLGQRRAQEAKKAPGPEQEEEAPEPKPEDWTPVLRFGLEPEDGTPVSEELDEEHRNELARRLVSLHARRDALREADEPTDAAELESIEEEIVAIRDHLAEAREDPEQIPGQEQLGV